MKRLFVLFVALAMVLGLAGCGSPEEVQPEEQVDYEIAMITENGLLMNGGYSEVAWNTISEFGASEGISHKYYKAVEASDDSYRQTIDAAVKGGAKIIIADGYSFSQTIYEKQEQYPDVKFVIIDAAPSDAESGETEIGKNTSEVSFASEQAGYLAGYGAVMDGMSSLGFMGDAKKPVIMDYGYGFLQGADKAAREMGTSVKVNYHYCTDDEDRDAVVERANEWYESGTEAIFACGSTVEQPVIESAELLSKKVIAYETDKSQMSDTVVTSAVKDIETALKTVLEQYKDDEFPGGDTVKYDASNGGIWLELEKGKLENLDKSDYNDVLKELENGDIAVKKYDAGGIGSLGLSNVQVSEQ